jgi:hypothetical protein
MSEPTRRITRLKANINQLVRLQPSPGTLSGTRGGRSLQLKHGLWYGTTGQNMTR